MSKIRLQPKGLFRTIPNTLLDKTILEIKLFSDFFSYKVLGKKYLRVKTFVLCKRLKKKQIVIPMHHFVIRLPLEPFGTRLFAKKIKCNEKQLFYMKGQHS